MNMRSDLKLSLGRPFAVSEAGKISFILLLSRCP